MKSSIHIDFFKHLFRWRLLVFINFKWNYIFMLYLHFCKGTLFVTQGNSNSDHRLVWQCYSSCPFDCYTGNLCDTTQPCVTERGRTCSSVRNAASKGHPGLGKQNGLDRLQNNFPTLNVLPLQDGCQIVCLHRYWLRCSLSLVRNRRFGCHATLRSW